VEELAVTVKFAGDCKGTEIKIKTSYLINTVTAKFTCL